jgi:Family of unknown function (DUF6125)
MSNNSKTVFDSMSRDDLLRALEMFANWLAHDGCWFLTAEDRFGMETAIELDTHSWERFAAAEAHRIATAFHIPQQCGLDALEKALGLPGTRRAVQTGAGRAECSTLSSGQRNCCPDRRQHSKHNG